MALLQAACVQAPAVPAAPCELTGAPVRALRIARPGASLHVELLGSGPPLVLVHGALDHRIFHPVLDALADERTLVCWDRRGHGRSRIGPGGPGPSLRTDVADLAAVADALDLGRFDLLALADGGPVAIDFALRSPRRVGRLVLLASYADDGARRELAEDAVREVLQDEGRRRRLLALPPDLDEDERQREEFAVAPHPLHELPLPRAWIEQWFACGCLEGPPAGRDYARLDDLVYLQVPTLLLCGERDRLTPAAHARAMAARLPRGVFVQIPGAGHLAFAERPELVLAVLRAFLR